VPAPESSVQPKEESSSAKVQNCSLTWVVACYYEPNDCAVWHCWKVVCSAIDANTNMPMLACRLNNTCFLEGLIMLFTWSI
jgi:hypothetical protein